MSQPDLASSFVNPHHGGSTSVRSHASLKRSPIEPGAMTSSQPKRPIFLALATLTIVAIFVQWRQVHRLTDQNATLRDQIDQLSTEKENDRRLISNRRNSDDLQQSEHNELLRLRSQVSQLKDAERENAQLRAE